MQIVCRFLNSAHNWFKFCLVFGGNCSWGLKGNLYNFLMGGECATRGSGSFETCIIVCFKQRIVSTVQLSGTYCSSPCRVSSLMVVRLCNIGNSFFRIRFVSISFWGSKLERKHRCLVEDTWRLWWLEWCIWIQNRPAFYVSSFIAYLESIPLVTRVHGFLCPEFWIFFQAS